MAQEGNKYADKVFSEHPIALWPLDEKVFYLSQINDTERNFANWTSTGAAAWTIPSSPTLSGISMPFEDSVYSVLAKSTGAAGTIEAQSPTLFTTTDVTSEITNFTINLFLYVRETSVNWIKYGIRYNNASGIPQEIISAQVPAPTSASWVNINETYNIPSSWSGGVKFFFQISMKDSTNDAISREFIMNGFSVGQGSEATCYDSLGVNAVSLPNELNLSSFLGYPADQYGLSDDNGYYLVRNNLLLSRNDGFPIIYGTDQSTKIYNTLQGFPSFVFPGKGMLHQQGRNKFYSLEMWIKADPVTTRARKIIGPLDSNDGIYVKEGFITLSIGDEIGSHCVSDWYRPMLIHVVLKEATATLMINGEEVISISMNRKTVDLSSGRDWWGVYSYPEIATFSIDTISIFPYIVSNSVAKRRFVYGLGTPDPQSLDASFYGTPTQIEFSTAQYNNNVIYPDIARWDAGYFNNLTATKDYLSVPSYSLPNINLGGRDVQEWYDNNYIINTVEYPDGQHPKFISFRPNQVTRTNLITNPSAETNTTNISARGTGTTIARITTDANIGTACIEVTKAAVASAGIGLMSGATARMPVEQLKQFATSAYVKIPTGNEAAGLRLRVVPFNSVGTQLTVQNSTSVSVTSAMGWTRLSFVSTMPANAVTAYVIVEQATAGTAGQKFLVDNVLFEQSSTVLPYFDGSYYDSSLKPVSYGWKGTAHASASTLSYSNSSGINYTAPSYFNFPSLTLLNDTISAVYAIFEAETNVASDRTLINFENIVNGESFDVVINADEVIYRINKQELYSEVITIGTEFVVGLNFDEAGLNFGYDVSRFFSSPSSIQMFVGGNGQDTFEGKIYTVGFCNDNNYSYVESYFYGTGQLGRGFVNPDFYDVMISHIASYTLVPEYEYGKLFLDIAVAAEWEEYFPLSYFATYVKDENGDDVYDLDMLQLNISYTSVVSTDVWSYYDVQQSYSTYGSLNTGTGPFSNYFNFQKNNTSSTTIDVSDSAIQTYVSFQSLASGANKPITEFQYFKGASANLVIDAEAENTLANPDRAYNTAFAFRDNTIVFPPKKYPFEDYAMVVHMVIRQRSTLKNPLKIRKFEISSKTFNYNTNGISVNKTPLGTKFGKKIYPQTTVYGGAIDGKWKNPYTVYKGSTPYLYTTKNSGIKVSNETYISNAQPLQNEVFIPINESAAFVYKVAAMQFMVKPDFINETADVKLMEIRYRDGTLTFVANKQGNFANIRVYKRASALLLDGGSPSTSLSLYSGNYNGGNADAYYTQYINNTLNTSTVSELSTSEYTVITGTDFYQNGKYVKNPLLKIGEWTAIGIALPAELSFDEYSQGGIALYGGFVFNNISYYQSDGLGIEAKVLGRPWSGVINDQVPSQPAPPNLWSYWSGSSWSYMYVLGTEIDFSSTPEDIFNAYTGTNSIIVDDGKKFDMKQKEVKIVTSATWSSFSQKPA